MALATVAANKTHLLHPNGSPFFILGVNYVGYFDRSWKMWETDWFDLELIRRDFDKIRSSGFNTVRLFIQSGLIRDIRRDDFAKLDDTLTVAHDYGLSLLLTLNDAHSLNLAGTGDIDAKIVERYKDVPFIVGYDLENEPVFYNVAAGIYPDAYSPPIQTSQLIDHYGIRVPRAEVPTLQQNRRIPGHLDEEIAFYYINGLELFLEYDQAIRAFTKQGRGTLIDFMLSAEAEPWYPLIGVLDGTVEAWLKARMEPIRAAGCQHLLTVGWSWLHFAGLPANRLLDFQEYHNYVDLTLTGFNETTAHLQSLRQAFPEQPLLLGEFGWSNQSGQVVGSSQPVSPQQTALYEAATLTYLRANAFAGGMKWMLNDVTGVTNPYEASFGVFREGELAKPIRALTERFSHIWPALDQQTNLVVLRNVAGGLCYRFDFPFHITIGGASYQDSFLSWQSDSFGHCFITLKATEIEVEAVGRGRLAIDPWDLLPAWDRSHETDLYRLYSDDQRTRQRIVEPGRTIIFDVDSGSRYAIALGAPTPVAPPPEGAPQVDPKPGEHVLLLADFETYMQSSLQYIRRFAPDFSFAVDEVFGRWAYVSVVATPEELPDTRLDDIRSAGAYLVERVIGDTAEATQSILDEMADRGQRFLTAMTPIPPQEEPPTEGGDDDTGAGETPPGDITETYIVQPGDTLSKIARAVYGDARLWPTIFEANRDKLADPSLIRVGMELHIPDRES